MPPAADRLERLRRLGLGDYAARAYLALLENGPSPARELTTRTNIPRGKIYATLDDLHARGLVDITPERPHRYTARPVADLVASLRRRHREALETLAHDEEALLRDLRRRTATPHAPAGPITVLRGRRNATDRTRTLLTAARHELQLLPTAGGLARLARRADDLEDALGRGVHARLTTPPDAHDDRLAALAHPTEAPPLAPDVTLLVVDETHAILHRAIPDDERLHRGDDIAILVEDPGLAAALAALARAWTDAAATRSARRTAPREAAQEAT